jgi:uncharacterized protein YxeA
MDVAFIRDLMIIILYALLTIIIIGGSIAAFIIYRRVNKRVQETVDTVQRPVKFAQKVVAYARGGSKGLFQAFNVVVGRDGKHVH